MPEPIASQDEIYETIALNTQKGDPYIIKLKEKPVVLTGTPTLLHGDEKRFRLRIETPEEFSGDIVEYSIDEIEFMRKIPG